MKIKLNLLSEAKKNEIYAKTRFRLLVVQEVTILLLLLFCLIILGSVYMMLYFKTVDAESANASERQKQSFQEIDSIEKKFQSVDAKVSSIAKFQREHIVWSNFFVDVDSIISNDILLDKLSTNDRIISLSGVASTRDALLQFQEKLNTSDCLRNAKVPLSDLFAQNDVSFQMDVEIKKECLKPGNI